MERVRIAVVLPCLNERSSVKEVICDWLSVSKNLDVYFCDNGSTDGSLEEAMLISDPRLHILQEEKRGKGCAVRKVLKEVSADVYVLCDVDCTYEASMRVIEPVLNGECDLCVGWRESYFRQDRRLVNSLGNRMASLFCMIGSHVRIKDPLSGLRAFSGIFAENLVLPDGFSMEAAMAKHAGKNRFKVLSIPIGYQPRSGEEASKISFLRDGFSIIKSFFL